jgi:hypothetical protein
VCSLAGDNVTILAGQNEAGKTAVLMALRDFDQPEGKPPLTEEYMPEGNSEAKPEVSILLEADPDEVNTRLADCVLPEPVHSYLREKRQLWITRSLPTGNFFLEDHVKGIWPKRKPKDATTAPAVEVKPAILALENAGKRLYQFWPTFVFFDSFQDQLPRQIAVEPLQQNIHAETTNQPTPNKLQGQSSVEDFLELAGISLKRVVELKDQDKSLGNYLKARTASITGDFLTYWKQSVDGDQQVELQVKHARNAQGALQLAFYVHDGVDQYPEQRSKGFLWFLSFYLRLAAEEKRDPNRTRLLLIDEPGTYLHAKAQKDVLHLIEDKLAVKQQVIYSTHSPYLLPTDKLHRLRIVLRHGDNGTIVVDRLTHPALRGEGFSDTLSPIITAIGIDIRERIGGLEKHNLLVEGFSDHTYLTAWCSHLKSPLNGNVCVFPGTGADSLPTLASLCIGWGLEFSVLLDRDDKGLKVAKKFERALGVNPIRIIHPDNAAVIEDVFDPDEFLTLLTRLDSSLNVKPNETPSKAIKRQDVDKILLARKFAESPSSYPKSAANFSRLLQTIEKSFGLIS